MVARNIGVVSRGFDPMNPSDIPVLTFADPVNGEKRDLVSSEDRGQFVAKYDYYVDTLCMWKPEDALKYTSILNDISSGKSILRSEEVRFVEETGEWKILIIWAKLLVAKKPVDSQKKGE